MRFASSGQHVRFRAGRVHQVRVMTDPSLSKTRTWYLESGERGTHIVHDDRDNVVAISTCKVGLSRVRHRIQADGSAFEMSPTGYFAWHGWEVTEESTRGVVGVIRRTRWGEREFRLHGTAYKEIVAWPRISLLDSSGAARLVVEVDRTDRKSYATATSSSLPEANMHNLLTVAFLEWKSRSPL
jgi:hypothetical protein